jgi:oligopeptide/dipeptide ABC transporter ATP-binding protein
VRDLSVGFTKGHGRFLSVIETANLTVEADQAVGLVGESGSGKTMLCRSIIGTLARRGAAVVSGQILFAGRDLAGAPERVWRQIRGRQIGYVPQSSLAGLNPLLTVKTQLVEALTAVRPIGYDEAVREALRLLDLVRIPRARAVLEERAHQLSGGMRQRVMIAAALSQRPRLLVADEPTTALDVTVQREILDLIRSLRRDLGMALILVSHDLSVIEEVCDTVVVMYAGATIEDGPVETVVRAPRHPYTLALRNSRVDLAVSGEELQAIAGDPPAVGAWPVGCRFWPRCPLATEHCRVDGQPPLRTIARQQSACLHAEQMADR